ncbi:hypothetical protein O181_016893 [Austropuccinia psidii MF-1]|uniref:CCHC-type domain-containing protein n=1 Tax=Austropuccinia psidii MF-1 TaxID=1389203 RepID=A0A9Q3C641_9BASI|nr:hypothetical protein [Austropuccinia psidii MF-1]
MRKRKNIRKYSPYKSSSFKEKQPFRVDVKDKPKERVEEVTKKKKPCHNCGSTDHYDNNCQKETKTFMPLNKSQKKVSPMEDFESDSMGNAIRGHSDYDQDPK